MADPVADPTIWEQLVSIAGPAVIGIAASLATTYATAWFTRRNDAAHLALRLAGILEEFALTCADNIADNGTHTESGGAIGKRTAKMPALKEFPDDDTWKSIDRKLIARAITLRSEIMIAEGAIAGYWEIDPGNILEKFNEEAGRCGYRAWQLASELRRQYRFPAIDPAHYSWNALEPLRREHDRSLELMRQRHQ